ncbi:hypothetical protein GQ54DRAFT_304523 [Martensiomyces pterosporus]|nr:hypothetical protein GQ54DRAFT_304523 [Martensiomyces pterosporus]
MHLPLRGTQRAGALRKVAGAARNMGHRHHAKSLIIDYDFMTKQVKEHESDMSPREFMLSGGEGVYTGMRTRISNSLNVLASSGSTGERHEDPERWRKLLVPLIREGLCRYKCEGDSKITILVGSLGISLQITQLMSPKEGHCWVRFAPGRRENPETKNLQWVHERESLESLIVPPINEVVLVEGSGGGEQRFFEGLSSNFFATRRVSTDKQPEYLNYQLVSAPLDSVLLGTVMKSVLQICERDGIEVVNEPVVDLERWSGAFISSTSRMVLPVSAIIYRDDEDSTPLRLDARDPLVEHLRLSVLKLASQQSTEI